MQILLALLLATAAPPDLSQKVDALFANYAKNDSPGCAVGVGRNGEILLERAYGMANLEFDIPLSPNTIFEAGSVSKQFTAAAVLALVQDGKLSLDDKAKKYLPELDASASDVTIRHLLNHTSGLRDWGVVVGLAGWPRGSRRYTMPHVLEVISRQRELNFTPGSVWSYSNSGYNLAAIVVERVSGQKFPDFVRERIFTPNNMLRSGWRDDYTRVVKGRATAYAMRDKAYVARMDAENIYGNCCLLTTVGDLLRWHPRDDQMTPSVLTDGQKISYALGLFTDKDLVYHSGATAGWRAAYRRRVSDGLTVAVLCNRADGAAVTIGDKVAALFDEPQKEAEVLPLPANAASFSGLYRDASNDAVMRVFVKDGRLRIGYDESNGPALTPVRDTLYRLGTHELEFDAKGLTLRTGIKAPARYAKVAVASPKKLDEFAGAYTSDEVGVTYTVAVEDGRLVAKLPPSITVKLDPTYTDAFLTDDFDLVHFTRDGKGRVTGFDVKSGYSVTEGTARVERIHFAKR
jgi:CubicO group peptidase (beta-lactamase class C family)